jgi:hypothetical protein
MMLVVKQVFLFFIFFFLIYLLLFFFLVFVSEFCVDIYIFFYVKSVVEELY